MQSPNPADKPPLLKYGGESESRLVMHMCWNATDALDHMRSISRVEIPHS